MRFVFTAPRYHTNQHYAAKALLDADHEVAFVVLRQGRSETYEALAPIVLGTSKRFDTLRRLAATLFGKQPKDVGGIPPVTDLFSTLRRLRPSAVVVRDPSSAYGLLAALIAMLIGSRLVFYSQTPVYGQSRKKSLLRAVAQRAMNAAWFTPVLGRPESLPACAALRYVPFVIPPQTNPGTKRWFAGGNVHLLAIGKFEPRKNHGMFLAVIARLSRSHAIRATIVGECSTDRHERELAAIRESRHDLGLEASVDIRVNLPFAEMQTTYSRHDVFVLASRDEPAAVSLLEAMSHSLPVVCSDSNGTSCYVVPGKNGLVFRTDDVDHLESCLDRIVRDRRMLVRMGHRSHELTSTRHAPARYVDALAEMATGPAR